MNNRIWELFRQANHPHPEYGGNDMFFPEEFAELIVRECYEECKDQLLDKKVAEDAGLTYNDGVMDCAIGLLQRFGVE